MSRLGRHIAALVKRLVRQELRELGFVVRRGPLDHIEGDEVRIKGYRADSSDELLTARHAQPYGFASRPAAGMDLVLVGRGTQLVAVGAEDRTGRPSLNDGEVALYHGDARVLLEANGTVRLNDGASQVARKGDACAFNLLDSMGGAVTGTVTINAGADKVKA